MTDPSIPNMSSSQRERLAYIDFRLYFAYFGDCDRLFRDNPITSVSHL